MRHILTGMMRKEKSKKNRHSKSVSGVSFPLVGRCPRLGVADLAGRSSGVLSGGPVGVTFGVAWLGGLPASFGVGARLRGRVSVFPPPFFSSVLFVCFLFFFRGGSACSSPCLPSAFCVANRVAVGACAWLGSAPAPWVGWVMYRLGLVALPVRLGSGSAGWAVAPGGSVRPWVKGDGVFGVPPPFKVPALIFWRWLVWAGRRRPCRARSGP